MDDGGIFPWLPTTGTPGGGACGITLELTTPGRKMGVDDSPSAIVVVLEIVKQIGENERFVFSAVVKDQAIYQLKYPEIHYTSIIFRIRFETDL